MMGERSFTELEDKSETANRVIGMRARNNVIEGVPGVSGGFQTYKRRKQTNSMSGIKGTADGKAHVEAPIHSVDQIVEEPSHVLKGTNSYNDVPCPMNNLDELLDLQRSVLQQNCPSSDRMLEVPDGNKNGYFGPTGGMASSDLPASHKEIDVASNGSAEKSDQHSINEKCLRAFSDIIGSPNFISLCKLLSENFRGINAANVIDFSHVNSRMKEGTYENSPMLFLSDVHEIWRKFRVIGSELVSLTTGLSDFSRTAYCQQVGHNAFEDGKHEFSLWESSADHDKGGHMDDNRAYKVCTCRSCGKKADGIDCLVCDSCEEIYHISCIKPPLKGIPVKSWYCISCTASGFGLRHDNCVVCERLNIQHNCVDENLLTNGHNHDHLDEGLKFGIDDDGFQQLNSKTLGPCKICGNLVEDADQFRICSHPFCSQKCYHVRCLTRRQLKSYDTLWYCPSCLCRVCLMDQDDDKIVLCDGCDHGYHIYCLRPPLASIPDGKWFCSKCEAGIQAIHRARSADQNFENNKNKGKDVVGGSENLVNTCTNKNNLGKTRKNGIEKESNKGGAGMDMLLNAANTLNYEERNRVAAI